MRGWLAGVVSVLVLLALIPVTAIAFVPGSSLPRTGANRYLSDSTAPQRLLLVTPGSTGVPASAESDVLDGNSVLLAVPKPVLQEIRPIGNDRRPIWTREVVSPDPAVAAGVRPRPDGNVAEAGLPRVTLRSSTSVGVSLHARYGYEPSTLEPALLELPADVAAGRSWSSRGRIITAQGSGDFVNESVARPGTDGCLVVESTTTLRLPAETRRTDIATWCPERGIIEGTPTLDLPRRQFTADWPRLDASDPATRFDAPTGRVSTPQTLTEHPGAAPEAGPVDLDRQQQPVITASGNLFSASRLAQDLLGQRPDGDSLRLTWWGLPGGAIQGLAAVGNTVLVTTSNRRLVAYADSGRRLWSAPLRDLSPLGAFALGPDRVVLATLGGRLEAYNLADGQRLWSRQVADGITGRPWVLGDTIYVSRRDGAGIAAHDAATGAERWTNDDLGYDMVGVARDGDTLLFASAPGALLLVHAETGESKEVAVAGYGQRPRQLIVTADQTVAAMPTEKGTLLLRVATGAVVAELPGVGDVAAAPDGWWVLEPGAVRRISITGEEVRRLRVDGPTVPGSRLQIGTDRIWLVDSGGNNQRVWWVR